MRCASRHGPNCGSDRSEPEPNPHSNTTSRTTCTGPVASLERSRMRSTNGPSSPPCPCPCPNTYCHPLKRGHGRKPRALSKGGQKGPALNLQLVGGQDPTSRASRRNGCSSQMATAHRHRHRNTPPLRLDAGAGEERPRHRRAARGILRDTARHGEEHRPQHHAAVGRRRDQGPRRGGEGRGRVLRQRRAVRQRRGRGGAAPHLGGHADIGDALPARPWRRRLRLRALGEGHIVT